jgi:TrkA-N domain
MSLLARLLPTRPSAVQTPADSDAQLPRDPGAPTGHRWSFRKAGRRLLGVLAEYQWWILGVATVAVFILGSIGAWKFLTEHPEAGANFSDAAYMSLKGFVLENDERSGLPWELEVARYLTPVVAGWATISALGLLFRDRVQQLKIPWMRGHVVICGLGEHVGIMFLRHLREARIRTVVVELNQDNPGIELCRSLGVPVIVGDAQRLKTLQAAGGSPRPAGACRGRLRRGKHPDCRDLAGVARAAFRAAGLSGPNHRL